MENAIIHPVYQQIAIDLAQRISDGEFQEHARLYGRSTLAGYYKVSPETIRRATILLQDMGIVSVSQGSGIEVSSHAKALDYVSQFKHSETIQSLKQSIQRLNEERLRIDVDIQAKLDTLISLSERFKNTNPFSPHEIRLLPHSPLLGKTIGEVNFWQNTGATIIAIRRDNQLILSPGPYALFLEDDTIIYVGEEGTFNRVSRFMSDK